MADEWPADLSLHSLRASTAALERRFHDDLDAEPADLSLINAEAANLAGTDQYTYWSDEEHAKFVQILSKYSSPLEHTQEIADQLTGKTAADVETHLKAYFRRFMERSTANAPPTITSALQQSVNTLSFSQDLLAPMLNVSTGFSTLLTDSLNPGLGIPSNLFASMSDLAKSSNVLPPPDFTNASTTTTTTTNAKPETQSLPDQQTAAQLVANADALPEIKEWNPPNVTLLDTALDANVALITEMRNNLTNNNASANTELMRTFEKRTAWALDATSLAPGAAQTLPPLPVQVNSAILRALSAVNNTEQTPAAKKLSALSQSKLSQLSKMATAGKQKTRATRPNRANKRGMPSPPTTRRTRRRKN